MDSTAELDVLKVGQPAGTCARSGSESRFVGSGGCHCRSAVDYSVVRRAVTPECCHKAYCRESLIVKKRDTLGDCSTTNTALQLTMTDTDTTGPRESEYRGIQVEPLPIGDAAALSEAVTENVARVIVGNDEVIEAVFSAILARGHVLLEDVPGVGKTMLARALATSVDCEFNRVQFTPDLLPSDITGVNVFNQKTREFEFNHGPVFANLVLGDEINRAPPKTQSALLEAMEESQVTVDGVTRMLPQPFTVIATQNAIEPDRTYELPFAELDRFMMKLSLGYPDTETEAELLDRTVEHHPIDDLDPVADIETLQRARETVAGITVREPVRTYAAKLAAYTRKTAEIGVSPRATISLVRAAQANALVDEREYVVPDDIKHVAHAVLAHRIEPGLADADADGSAIVTEAVANVPVE